MATHAMDDLATHAFELVNRELASTLDAARGQLEDYVDGRAGADALLRTAEHLHIARGALKIVEIHGAALLADEMEQTCRRLAEAKDELKSEQGIEALTRAMVQLPAYLERLLGGGKDIALALLPLLNDLRQARDKPSLSEGTLVLLNASPFERQNLAPRSAGAADVGRGFDKLAHRLRPAFQAALLGWIKGSEPARFLDELLRVCTNLERAAASDQVKQLWTVLNAVLTAIRGGGLEASISLKRLIGQVDRQLKRLIDGGESAVVNSPPVELINSLLYYVAKANSQDPRIEALRKQYNLGEMLPGQAQIEQAREGLAGPSVKLMRTVAQAITEDLGTVKDALDIFVRTGMQAADKLGPQVDMLKKIGDTLGVLGLDKARGQIQRETQELAGIITNGKVLDPSVLEKIAATLLAVEDTLDRELVRAVLPGDEAETAEAGHSDTQQRQVTQAVMGECTVNLAKVKEAVIQLVEHPGDSRPLEQARPQLRGITAGLLMLGKTKAVTVVERIGEVIGTRLAVGTKLRPEYLERLADAIVSVEYYMETVSAGRSDPWYMLDNADRCLDLLETLPVAKPAPICASSAGRGSAATSRRKEARGPAAERHARRGGPLRSRARRGLHRGSQRGDREYPAQPAAVDRRSYEFRGLDQHAPLVPHAEGQRPHGRRAADRRVCVEHRESAESAHQSDARADAEHDGLHHGSKRRAPAAARAARDRSVAEGRRAGVDEASGGICRRRSRRCGHHGESLRVAALPAAPAAASLARAQHGPRARRHLRQGDAWSP